MCLTCCLLCYVCEMYPTQKFRHTGKLGRELGASISPNRTLLEAQQYNTTKQTYEAGKQKFFEDTMRGKMDSSNHLMEAMHLRRYQEQQYKAERTAAQVRHVMERCCGRYGPCEPGNQPATVYANRHDAIGSASSGSRYPALGSLTHH